MGGWKSWNVGLVDQSAVVALVLAIVIVVTTAMTEQDGYNFTRYQNVQNLTHAPTITMAPRDQLVAYNGCVSLFCKASGDPAPDVYWRKGGKRITTTLNQGYITINMPHGSVLRVENVGATRDDGIVECVADNGVGDPAVATAKLEVYPEGQTPSGYPRIVKHPNLKAVEKDRNMVMICSATGNPEPMITWLKDGIPVDLSDPRLKLLPTGSLQIQHSLESDEGKYECVAENSVGVVCSYGANLYVRVRRIPPHFATLPESVEVMPGGSANLTCEAIGSPVPKIKWRLGALELTNETDIPTGKNILMLSNIRETTTYTCVAFSDLGHIEHDAEVRVKDPEGAPQNFTAIGISGTSVKLQWDTPVETKQNGEIVIYEVLYYPRAKPQDDSIANTSNTMLMVESLDTNTVYNFQIRAYSIKGAGPWSNILHFRTSSLGPEGAPQNFTILGISGRRVKLQWDPPLETKQNGEIVIYEVLYHPRANPLDNRFTNTSDTMLMVDWLNTNTVYNFQIRAYSSKGPGPWSNILHFRTFIEAVLPAPTNVQVRRISLTAMEVTWDPVVSTRTVDYRIYYTTLVVPDVEKWNSMEIGPYTVTTLGALEPDAIYAVLVKAKSIDGRLSNSSRIAFAAPAEVGAPRFRCVTADSMVMLKLFSVSEKHGPISHYYVIVVPHDESDRRLPHDFDIDELRKVNSSDWTRTSWIAARFDEVLPSDMLLGDNTKPGTGEYLNPALSPDLTYKVFVRAFNAENEFISSPFSLPITTNGIFSGNNGTPEQRAIELLWIAVAGCAAVFTILF